MIETAEAMREKYRISREEQDEYAARSHHRAAAAAADGRFDDEIVPVTVPGRKTETLVEHDEHIRPGTSVEQLARLRPIMLGEDPDATVTAGNASGRTTAPPSASSRIPPAQPNSVCASWSGSSPGACPGPSRDCSAPPRSPRPRESSRTPDSPSRTST
jgi:hypothetical protein